MQMKVIVIPMISHERDVVAGSTVSGVIGSEKIVLSVCARNLQALRRQVLLHQSLSSQKENGQTLSLSLGVTSPLREHRVRRHRECQLFSLCVQEICRHFEGRCCCIKACLLKKRTAEPELSLGATSSLTVEAGNASSALLKLADAGAAESSGYCSVDLGNKVTRL